jgi:uncharacterized membrane protein YedE/YeeE
MKRAPATLETPVFQDLGRASRRSRECSLDGGTDDAHPTGLEEQTMTVFTPYASLAGGALIGLAASLLLIGPGRIAGISGITSNALLGSAGERVWRAAFLLGLLLAGSAAALFAPGAVGDSPRPLAAIAAAGLLVGLGTRLGGGCTSGHGVCGVSRLAPRSLVATLTFLLSGGLTVALWRWLGAGA